MEANSILKEWQIATQDDRADTTNQLFQTDLDYLVPVPVTQRVACTL